MIKQVVMQNLKSKNKAQELTGKDIIIGKNGSGKTSIHQAIGIAIHGYVPGQGKTAADTYKLASGDTMGTGLVTDNLTFTRSFTQVTKEDKKSGETTVEIKQDITLSPGQGEKGISQKQARIYGELGNFPVMLDFSEFLSLSDAKRREFIYNLSPIKVDSWSKEKIEKHVSDSLLTLELKTNNPDKYVITCKAIEETMNAYPPGFDVQAGLTAMIDFVKKKLSYWNEKKDNSKGAVSELAEMKNKLEETDRGINSNKKELEELQKKLVSISELIAKDTERAKAIEKRNKKIFDIKADIENIKQETCTLKIGELQEQIAAKQKLLKPDFDYEKQRTDIQNSINNIKKKIEGKRTEYNTKLAAKSKVENEIQFIADTLKVIQENEITKSVGEEARTTHKCVINPLIKCEKDFSTYIKYSDDKLAASRQELAATIKENADLQKDISDLQKEQQQLESDKEASFKAEKAHTEHNNKLKEGIASLKTSIATAQNFDTDKAIRVETKKKELQELETEGIDEEGLCDLETSQTQKAGYESNIAALKTKIDEQNKAKITIASMQTSMVDNKQATYYADAYKLISESLGAKGIQGEMVKGILDPIKADIQEKFDKLKLDTEFFFNTESDTGREVFQFGWIKTREDKWNGSVREYHNFDALSTGEQLLLLVALMITIIEKSNPKLKLLAIDNINDLDRDNFYRVLDALEAIGGSMDNIILSGVVDMYLTEKDENGIAHTMKEYKSFKVWNLSEDIA